MSGRFDITQYCSPPVIIVIVIVLTILILYYLSANKPCDNPCHIKGFWVAPASFLASSEVSTLMVYIDDHVDTESGRGGHSCYLVIDDKISGNIFINHMVKSDDNNTNKNPFKFSYRAKIDWLTVEPVWDSCVNIDLDLSTGKMTIGNKDTIFAILYKDNEISDM